METRRQALVVPVNCDGVFAKAMESLMKACFPRATEDYRRACQDRTLRPGRVLVSYVEADEPPSWLMFLPIRDSWRRSPSLEILEAGLPRLAEEIMMRAIESVAIPPLGCGPGGLNWQIVSVKLQVALSTLAGNVEIDLYEPVAASRLRKR